MMVCEDDGVGSDDGGECMILLRTVKIQLASMDA